MYIPSRSSIAARIICLLIVLGMASVALSEGQWMPSAIAIIFAALIIRETGRLIRLDHRSRPARVARDHLIKQLSKLPLKGVTPYVARSPNGDQEVYVHLLGMMSFTLYGVTVITYERCAESSHTWYMSASYYTMAPNTSCRRGSSVGSVEFDENGNLERAPKIFGDDPSVHPLIAIWRKLSTERKMPESLLYASPEEMQQLSAVIIQWEPIVPSR